ncbi:pyrimidine 5'-nucleotidase [Parvibium lacunae]|uniref:Pyrimidine 5'-nucleotidase n=1 Tax=Parvibium lacunae TaxID=1888893 RepID=A0A368L0Q1_9BURK|nr:pyrimidine 5'-nucleotidase [Parvibium lacunae]RCS57116.1 pyrimidine 5'-nucleotidase [Parvibium lacunae]
MSFHYWFFDLDNTLHHAGVAIFPRINQMMTAYVAEKLCLDLVSAQSLRQAYWQRYGATMLGLIRHHAIDPHEFLAASHTFPDLATLIRSERGLRDSLRRLPGHKRLLTNAPYGYATRVIQHLGLHMQLGRLYAIEHMRLHGEYRPKPSRRMLRAILARERIPARRAVLIEDSLENLKAARALGMRTVWVTGLLGPGQIGANGRVQPRLKPKWCDVQVKSIQQLARVSQRLASPS